MDVSHAILFLENADFVRITGLYFPAKFELINRKQVGKPCHHWSYEKNPVTKVTGEKLVFILFLPNPGTRLTSVLKFRECRRCTVRSWSWARSGLRRSGTGTAFPARSACSRRSG